MKANVSPAEASRLSRLGALMLLVGSTAASIVAYVSIANLDTTAVALPHASHVRLLAPEGWKFFTRSPHDDEFGAFVRDGANWRPAFPAQNADPAYIFGANRAGRAHGVEMGLLMADVSKEQWRTCEGDPRACLSQGGLVRVRNGTPAPSLCGEVGLVTAPPIPWQWARLKKTTFMPSHVVRLEIQC
jgi:antimicrobial peptide system SdpA family protein